MRVVDLDDVNGDGKELRHLRGAKASRACNNLETIRIRAHGDGLDQSVLPDAGG